MTTAIHRGPDFVHVTYSPDLRAVVLKWHDEYDEGPLVRDAVLAAVDYVNQHRVAQWLADISTSRRGLSNKDLAWVNGEEFRGAIMDSTLRKFVLMPPLPETGQDTSWLKSWAPPSSMRWILKPQPMRTLLQMRRSMALAISGPITVL